METRLIIGYSLVAFVALSLISFAVMIVRNQRRHRRRMRGNYD